MKKSTMELVLSFCMTYGAIGAAWYFYDFKLALILFVLVWGHNIDKHLNEDE